MASDFIAIDTQGLEQLQTLLKRLPPEVRGDVVDAVSDYLINVFRHYPPSRYVSRKSVYGQSFQSDKQRRWFFANLREGNIQVPYRRTQTLSRGWTQIDRGESSMIANETPYAAWVMGPGEQSRHAVAIGWKDVGTIAKEREGEINRRGGAAAKEAIRKLGG